MLLCLFANCQTANTKQTQKTTVKIARAQPLSARVGPANHCLRPGISLAVPLGPELNRQHLTLDHNCHKWKGPPPCSFARKYLYIYIHLSIDLSIDLSIYRSIDLSIYRSIDLSIYLSIDRSIYLSIDRSIYLSIYLSNLSVCLILSYLILSFLVHLINLCIIIYLSIHLSNLI